MWVGGTGQVLLSVELALTDTAAPLKRLMKQCIQYDPKERPLFPKVLETAEKVIKSLPKIPRSLSGPISQVKEVTQPQKKSKINVM